MKRFHWILLGFAASVCIAAVAPTGGGGSSGVPTLNGTATNLQVYSSGTTNRPLRVYGTNGTTEVYVDKDAVLVGKTGNYNAPSILMGESGAGWATYAGGAMMVKANGQYGPCFFADVFGPLGGVSLTDLWGIYWASSYDPNITLRDTGLSRNAAGVLEVNNGTRGTYRDLITRSTFATNASITNITADSYVTTQQTLSYASATNLTVDANKSLHFVSLTNTAYFAQPSNLGVGRTFTVILQQDGTGTRAVTFNTNYWKFPGGVVPTITTNANAYDVLSCISCPYGTNVFAIHNAKFQ